MKIVIVEDEAVIRGGLAGLIPKLSPEYEIAGLASDGREGLEVIARTHPDLVIMDIQMPEMDGLEMLRRLREREVMCRVIVLTAYNKFEYAKQAIHLGIENYLLKPIKIPELQETLDKIYRQYQEEAEQNGIRERLFSLEQIIRGCILAEVEIDDNLDRIIRSQYGVGTEDSLAICGVSLDEHYDEDREQVVRTIESYAGKSGDYAYTLIQSSRFHMILFVLYRMKDPDALYRRSIRTIAPAMIRNLKHTPVMEWILCRGFHELPEAFGKLVDCRKWNLCFPVGTMIPVRELENHETVPLRYSMQIEGHLKTAVIERRQDSYQKVLQMLIRECQSGTHHPDEIREICVRFCLAILAETQVIGRIDPRISRQDVVGRVSGAVTWETIEKVFEELYHSVVAENENDANISPLIRHAIRIIEGCYSEGITLEELAGKLGVLQEYLSTQFKKETGSTFKETVRRYQIVRVKELLLQSNLKLGQIADMAGYSDPKYMSRVFREEVGMLPTEFRNKHR